jgi:hypothetical protein
MIGQVVSSHYEDLGPIDPNLLEAEPGNNFRAGIEIKTQTDSEGGSVINEAGRLMVIRTLFDDYVDIEETHYSNPTESISHAVTQIDNYYRQYRGIQPDTVLRHGVTYKVGVNRSDVTFHANIASRLLRISGPSGTHFDSFMNKSAEAVMVNHRGTPSRIFVGPTRKFTDNSGILPIFNGELSRLFVPTSQLVPHDRAILFDRNTLHRQSAQFHNPRRPSVWLRTVIRPIKS